MIITSFDIKNFRGVTNLHIEDMAQINILLGRNGCGKTTVMESVYQLVGIFELRGTPYITKMRRLSSHDFTEENSEFIGMCGSSKFSVRAVPIDIKKDTAFRGVTFYAYVNDMPIGEVKWDLVTDSHGEPIWNHYLGRHCENYTDKWCVYENFLYHMVYPEKAGLRVRNLNDQMMGDLLSVLRHIDPSLREINDSFCNAVIAHTAKPDRISTVMMGEGFSNVISILTAVMTHEGSTVLIDNFESNLHYSVLKPLWSHIIKYTVKNNIQLFVTTQSWECMLEFMDAFKESGVEGEKVRMFRIDRRCGDDFVWTHKAVRYTYEMMEAGFEEPGIECR